MNILNILIPRLRNISSALIVYSQTNFPFYKIFQRKWRISVAKTRFSLLPKSIRNGCGIVVDVGANRGVWASSIKSLIHPSKMILFEPISDLANDLRIKFAHQDSVVIRELALSDRKGDQNFEKWSQSELSSLKPLSSKGKRIHKIKDVEPSIECVKVSTLDSELLNIQRISILKIDVQGAEREVLMGALNTLQKVDCLI
jgi:FkbM family methyltransferase